jgi:cyclopropane fatty-acyl-phospholipid synthase-like methyltransferase
LGNIEYFDDTEAYLRLNPVITLRKRIVKDLAGNLEDMQILDVGCGSGQLTLDYISKNQITFIDTSQNMLSIVKKSISKDSYSNAKFENSDVLVYNPNEKFDLIICVGLIAHIGSVTDLIDKLNELSSTNGRIIVQFTANEKLISKLNLIKYRIFRKNNYDYHVNSVSTTAMEDIISNLGLRILKKINYFPVSPFFSIFNYSTRLRLLNITAKNRFLGYFGPETILLLSKS